MTTYIFNLDGTNITNGEPLNSNFVEAIFSLEDSARIIFTSVRPVRDLLPLLPHELRDCLMIGSHGAVAWQQGEYLHTTPFEAGAAHKILDWLQQHQVPYILEGIWSFSTSAVAHPFHADMRNLTDGEIKESDLINQGISKILILSSEFRTQIDRFLLKEGFEYSLHHHQHNDIFDISPGQANKYQVLKMLGVDFNHTIAFGNDRSDFEILNNAGISIFTGEPHYYAGASHYCKTEALPALLNEFSTIQE
ncbi:HAD hydrolase family protein [Erwiniaceae bacterium CAU 1747]